MKWPTVPLGELTTVFSGFAFKSDRFNRSGTGLPLVRIRDVKGGNTETFYDGEFAERFVVSDGDLLVGMDGEFNCAPWTGGRALLNQRVCRVSASDKRLDQHYLRRYLPIALKVIERRTSFVTVKHLSPKDITAIAIPLPPLPEQQRIAAILDQADALCRLRRQSLLQLNTLTRSIFEDRFGGLEPVVLFEEIVSDTLIGLVRGADDFGEDFEIPYVRMDAISRSGEYLPEKVQRTNATDEECSRYALQTGDMLFNTRNSRELVGKTAIYRGTEQTIFNNNLMRIRFEEEWESVFVESFFRSGEGRRMLEKRKSGTTSVWAVYWSQLKTLKLPRVSSKEQLSYRSAVETVWQKKDVLEAHAKHLDVLFASLQHRAFRGEL